MTADLFPEENLVLIQNKYQANIVVIFSNDTPVSRVKFDDGREIYINMLTLEER